MIKKILIIFVLLHTGLNAQTNLQDLQTYASKIKEDAVPDTDNYVAPRYSRALGKKRSTFIDNFFKKLVYRPKKTFWSPSIYQEFLDLVIEYRQKEKFHGKFIQSLPLVSDSRIIMFGDLQGAYHSLVRDLEFLQQKGIIKEDLTIADSNTHIVFSGNIVNRSPYLLPTLTLVLMLMYKNPKQVFFIRGKDEQHKELRNELFGQEVGQFFDNGEEKKLMQKTSQLFNTLPMAIACTVNKAKPTLLLTSGGLSPEIKDLAQTQKPTISLLDIKAICQGVSEKFIYARSSGLILSEQEYGINVWTLASAPTPVYTKLFDFYYDAFCFIDIKQTIEQSTIKLLNQDIRTKKGISPDTTYCLATGSEITKERSSCSNKPPIVMGCTLDLSKGLQPMSESVKQGLSFRINNQNIDGGIKGHPLKVVYLNDQYTPHKAVENIETFKNQYKTNFIIAPLGTPTLRAYLDKVKANKALVFFPPTGSPLFRDPALTSIIHFRPSYEKEGEVLMKHALKTSPRLKYLVFYQNDNFGQGALKGIQKAFNQNKQNRTLHEVAYDRNQINFSNILPEIKNYNPDVILFASTSAAATELIRQLETDYFSNRKILGISDLSEVGFKEFMDQKGVPYTYLQVLPPASKLTSKIMKKYFIQIGKYNLPFDVYSLEGYLVGSLIIHALNEIQAPYTPEKVMKQLEAIDTDKITGFNLKFNPQTRELSNKLWLITDAGTKDQKIKEMDANHI
ncbi:ABC transporter substrate-binding protein [bacterium]|jgi:branched-chain amino acid transport system substrate-binding protein|nr:ABC transporter substrate-binding protein [bacterium]